MSRSIHSIARHFLNKDSLDQCSFQEIKDLAEQHPYASALQFLLLEKLRSEDQEAYNRQLGKAILYYHDPLSFQSIINPARFVTEISEEEVSVAQFSQPEVEEPLPVLIEEKGVKEEDAYQAEEIEPVEEPEVFIDHSIELDNDGKTNEETIQPLTENPGAIAEEDIVHFVEEPASNNEDVVLNSENNSGTGKENPVTVRDEGTVEEMNTTEIRIPPINIPKSSENDLVFDPYHTVDYFASQGIKLSQDEFSKDKFGKQLKSFTEWLKSMKRLPANQAAEQVDSKTEDKVQHLAEDSIHQSEVYTEAMADVWLKQGNKAKAIEVYNKLSLLNPSKRAYFATQIENLKHT